MLAQLLNSKLLVESLAHKVKIGYGLNSTKVKKKYFLTLNQFSVCIILIRNSRSYPRLHVGGKIIFGKRYSLKLKLKRHKRFRFEILRNCWKHSHWKSNVLGMKDFDFLPKFCRNFAQNLINLNDKMFDRGCGCIYCISSSCGYDYKLLKFCILLII